MLSSLIIHLQHTYSSLKMLFLARVGTRTPQILNCMNLFQCSNNSLSLMMWGTSFSPALKMDSSTLKNAYKKCRKLKKRMLSRKKKLSKKLRLIAKSSRDRFSTRKVNNNLKLLLGPSLLKLKKSSKCLISSLLQIILQLTEKLNRGEDHYLWTTCHSNQEDRLVLHSQLGERKAQKKHLQMFIARDQGHLEQTRKEKDRRQNLKNAFLNSSMTSIVTFN